MTYEEDGEAMGFADDIDPDSWLWLWLWLPSVDYVSGWQTAQRATEALRASLLSVGLARDQFTGTAGTLSDGRGIVRLKGTVDGERRLAQILAQFATEAPTEGT